MKNIMIGVRFFIAATILTGLFYPVFITLIGQAFFPQSSNGRLDLIGQQFDQDKYFWPRPSSQGYNPLPSGGSNLSPTSKQLKDIVEERKQKLLKADPTKTADEIPADLIYASASGLDPHISPAAAVFQVERVAKARGLDSAKKDEIIKLIDKLTEGRDFGVLGEPRVNVLTLNAELDKLAK
ncbi:MAG: potassium-transporting ATPase subunit KdpC [Candidatus Margulisbacteria bacterium]|nr:potassium-transporting ATPase subunit KdpC [Candidatus Margulisiibacteriota bacterium]